MAPSNQAPIHVSSLLPLLLCAPNVNTPEENSFIIWLAKTILIDKKN